MPDITVILCDGTVGGEHTCFRDVHETLAAPALRVAGVITECLVFTDDVGIEIRKRLEPVLMNQLIVKTGQILRATDGKHLRAGQEVDRPADIRVAFIPLLCNIIPRRVAMDDLIRGLAENVDALLSYLLRNFDIRTIHGAERQCAVLPSKRD